MPTLFRFLYVCGLIAGTIYCVMLALAYLVEPRPREVIIKIPSERVNVEPKTDTPAEATP